jgi:thymidylate synthase (FAD)
MTPSAKLLAVTMPLHEPTVIEGWEGVAEVQMPKTPGLDEPLDLIEYAGRWDYGPKSIAKMGDPDIIRRWLESGEESMVEMVDATFLITCSRVVTHELVRHRLASYQQESQRFVSYKDEDPEELFFLPPEVELDEESRLLYERAVYSALGTYNALVERGVPKQIARYVLPNATRTRIIVKTNLREWRHILRLRLHKSAQPEMRVVMAQVHEALQEEFGKVLFPDDIAGERAAR